MDKFEDYGSPEPAKAKPEGLPDREAVKVVGNAKMELLDFIKRAKSMASKYEQLAEFYTNEADVVTAFLQQDYYAATGQGPLEKERIENWRG